MTAKDCIGSTMTMAVSQATIDLFKRSYHSLTNEDIATIDDHIRTVIETAAKRSRDAKDLHSTHRTN